jgi:ketopantoate reductase
MVQIELITVKNCNPEAKARCISEPAQNEPPIMNLIWCTRARYAYEAIYNLRHRLRRDSTVMFVQTGMGILDRVITQIFPDISSRPTFIQASVSHPLWQGDRNRDHSMQLEVLKLEPGRRVERIFDVYTAQKRGGHPAV